MIKIEKSYDKMMNSIERRLRSSSREEEQVKQCEKMDQEAAGGEKRKMLLSQL